MMTSRISILLLSGALLAFSACTKLQEGKSIKLAHGLDITHPVHVGMVRLAELVEEKSAGKLRVEIYPSQQLGTERQCLELLQIGSLGMTKVSSAVLENFAPIFQVMSLPYIFRDENHAYAVLDGPVGSELLLATEPFYLRGLCYYDAGSRSFYSKNKPINSPADLKGMKIRVQESVTAVNMIRSMGGAPTPISWGELYTALQQGVVDAAENNPPSVFTSRHYEVCKYYILNEHTAVPDVLVISTIVWNSLSPQEQRWLQEAADESVVYQREVWKKFSEESLAEVEKAGVQIIRPDKAPFAASVEGMIETYRQDAVAWDLIERIRAVQSSESSN